MSHLGKLLIAALIALSPAVASAQLDTATAIGTVLDAQGAALPGVTVTARNVETGFVRTRRHRRRRAIPHRGHPAGLVRVQRRAASFATGIRKGVRLTVGAEAVINFELALANVSEQVTVTADTPIVETTTAAVQSTITREQIDLLPLSARDYTNVIRLVPGAAANNSSYGFGGSRGRSNTWNVDGVDNSDEISGFAHQSPGARFHQGSPGAGERLQGRVWTGLGRRHQCHHARRHQRLPWLRLLHLPRREPDVAQPVREPAAAEGSLPAHPVRRGGRRSDSEGSAALLRQLRARGPRHRVGQHAHAAPRRRPISRRPTRQFLATHDIPLSLFGDGGTVRHVRPEYVDIHKTTARIDNQVGANQFYTVRYLLDSNDSPSGQSGTLFDYNGGLSYLRTDYVNLNHKWILGTNKLNEAYVQFGRHKERIDAVYNTLPTITVTGGFTLGSGSNFNPVDNKVLALNDIFTWTKSGGRLGDHVVRTGAQIEDPAIRQFLRLELPRIVHLPEPERLHQRASQPLHAAPGRQPARTAERDLRLLLSGRLASATRPHIQPRAALRLRDGEDARAHSGHRRAGPGHQQGQEQRLAALRVRMVAGQLDQAGVLRRHGDLLRPGHSEHHRQRALHAAEDPRHPDRQPRVARPVPRRHASRFRRPASRSSIPTS